MSQIGDHLQAHKKNSIGENHTMEYSRNLMKRQSQFVQIANTQHIVRA
jgi:hypothetical protein